MHTVLIADDEVLIRDGLTRTVPWKELGFEVICIADNGLDALSFIKSNRPDMALLDICMPGISGLGIAEEIYSAQLKTKVIIISGYNDFEYARDAIKFGVKEYIFKPSSMAEIVESIKRLKITIEDDISETKTKDTLKKIVENNKDLLKRSIINKSIHGELSDKLSKIEEQFSLLDLNLVNFNLITIEHYRCDIEEKNLLRQVKIDYPTEINVCIINNSSNEELILYTWDDRKIENTVVQKALTNHYELIKKRLVREISGDVRMGMSGIYHGECELKKAYSKCTMVAENIIGTFQIEKIPYSTNVVKDCLIYISENIGGKLKMEDLAEYVHMSQGYLFRRIKNETGLTFLSILERFRIEKAKNLLLKKDSRVYEVAEKVGCVNVKHFTKLFKKMTGLKPTEYRKRISEN